MRKFQSLDRQAKAENDTSLDTVHQNSIKSMQIYSSSNGNVTKLSTTGLDGQLVIWDLNVSMSDFKISIFNTVANATIL